MIESFDDVDVERLRRRRTVKWSLYGPEILAAWVAEMDFDTAPAVHAAIVEAVEREDFGYVAADIDELTTACAAYMHSQYTWGVEAPRVFPVADVLTGIRAAFDVFDPDRRPVVVPTPAYPPFFEIVELSGRSVAPVPMHPDRLDVERIGAALARGAHTVLLCNPHNPTGRVFTNPELRELSEVVELHGARVVADEVHAPLVYPGARHEPYASVSDASAHHAVTVTSMSKACNLAGLKCAQVIASNHDDAKRWRSLRVFEVAGPTPIGIAASIAAYRASHDWLQGLVSYLDANRRLLVRRLADETPGIRCSLPEATFLAWLDCADLQLGDPARFFLERADVALSDGPPFGDGWEQHVRLNFATSRSLLDQILDAMAAALHE
jgi:cystathionine beta-lyase